MINPTLSSSIFPIECSSVSGVGYQESAIRDCPDHRLPITDNRLLLKMAESLSLPDNLTN
jgi:hypothetical protein